MSSFRCSPLLAVATLGVCIICGCSATSARKDPLLSNSDTPITETSITVIDRGWHTDIALPAEALTGPVADLGKAFPGVRYLVFGFGDRAYFISREESFLAMLVALFPGPAVILVTALRVPPADAFGADHVVTLRLSHDQSGAVTSFILRALEKNADGSAQPLGEGPYPGSMFYASGDIYDAFHNCNSWTLGALHSGGLMTDPRGIVFANQVMEQASRIAAQQRRL